MACAAELSLRELCPELQLPPITDDDKTHLIEQLCHGAVGYKDIKEREVKPVVMSWLSHAQTRIARQTRAGTIDAAERPHAEGGL